MKRGLVVLDEKETPRSALEGRVASLQRALEDKGVAAALIYGDVYHSGDITYLSNICIYWNEAVLAVPARGEPALITKLSRRVQTWMRASSNLEDLRSGPNLAAQCAEWLEAAGHAGAGLEGPVGLVERAWWPAPLEAALARELEGRSLVDLGGVVRSARELPDTGELALLRAGATLSARSVATALEGVRSVDDRAGLAELTARRGGVEDVAVYSRPAGPDAEVVEVVGEYRGYWTAAGRVLARRTPSWGEAFEAAYRAATRALREGVTPAEVRRAAEPQLSRLGCPFTVDLLHHVDVETSGGYRMAPQREAPFGAGSVASLRLGTALADGSIAAASDTFLIEASGAERLSDEAPEPALVAGA